MKVKIRPLHSIILILTLSPILAMTAPQDTVSAAAQKMAKAGSYTWKTISEGGNFNPGPTEGKIDADGTVVVSRSRRDNTYRTVYHGKKAAMETSDGWMSIAELENDTDNRRNQFWARMLQNFQTPVDQVGELLKDVKGLQESDGAITGQLTEAGVKKLLTFRRRGNSEGPDVQGAEGSVKFWVKDGALTKYQYHVKGSMSFNGNDFDVDRTTTTTFTNVGSTKVEIPEGAKKKLS